MPWADEWGTLGSHTRRPLPHSGQTKVPFSSLLLTFKSTEYSGIPCCNCAEMSFSSTEGTRQIPLNEHFLAGLASVDLKPEEILESVYIPHSQKVRILLVAFESCFSLFITGCSHL